MESWKELIKSKIEEKIEETKHYVIQRRINLQEMNKEGLLKKIKSSLWNTMGKIFTQGVDENSSKDMQKAISSTIAQELGQFVFYFSNLGIRFEKAQEILRYFGNIYGLNPMKIYEM